MNNKNKMALLSLISLMSLSSCGVKITFRDPNKVSESTSTGKVESESTSSITSGDVSESSTQSESLTESQTESSSESSTTIESSSPFEGIEPITETNSVVSYVPYNTDVIKKDASVPTDYGTVLEFNVAKNERETAQIILNNKTSNQLSYQLDFTNFYSDNNKKILKSSIESYVELYHNIDSIWSETANSPDSWYPHGKTDLQTGYYPDALEPYDVTKYLNNNKFDNTHGNNQGLFFVFDSSNYESGTYEGYLNITLSNDEILKVKTIINIFDFELPSENHSKMMLAIDTTEIESLYQNRWPDSKYVIDAYNMLLERHVSPLKVPGSSWSESDLNNSIQYLKQAAIDDNTACYGLSINYDLVNVEVKYKITSKSSLQTTTFENLPLYNLEDTIYTDGKTKLLGLKSVFTRLVNESTNEVDLFKKMSIYFAQADEPSNDRGYIQNIICQNIVYLARDYCLENLDFTGKDKVKKSLENIHYIATADTNSRLYNGYNQLEIVSYSGSNSTSYGLDNLKYKTLDGYIPLYKNYLSNATGYANLQDALTRDDKEIWWYSCCQPVHPYSSYSIPAPLVTVRANRFQQYYLGVEGEYYFECNKTRNHINGNIYSLTEDELLEGKQTWEGAHGDGLLIYPVYNRLSEYNKSKTNKVNYYSSLRLENISEGNDDYNYLYYADELINKVSNQTKKEEYKNRLNAIMTSLFIDVAGNTSDPELLKTKRLELAALIEELV